LLFCLFTPLALSAIRLYNPITADKQAPRHRTLEIAPCGIENLLGCWIYYTPEISRTVSILPNMSRPFKLYRLQQIDSQLDRMDKRLQEIEAALNEDEALQLATLRAKETDADMENARKLLHQAEAETRQQRLKIEQSEFSLYGGKIRNPKELQDLGNEVAALKRYLSVLEDRQLEAMLVEEEAAEQEQIAYRDLDKERARFAQQSKEMLEEKERLLKDVNRSKEERQAVASSIPEEDLDLYTQIRTKRHGIAVAMVTDNSCSACGSTLNAVLLHAARSPLKINCCDTCGRILYLG
jgi:predicted  nucleic acid-binding Zn-ribbon protein